MKILFSKSASDRKKDYQIKTLICEEDGKKFVLKLSSNDDLSHLDHMYNSYLKLCEIYGEDKICKCEKVEGGLKFDYIEGKTLQELASQDLDKAIDLFISILDVESNKTPFVKSADFVKWLGDTSYEGQGLKVSNIDLLFSNIIVKNDSFVLIDYEWCFDFNVPRDLIIYRSLSSFFDDHKNLKDKLSYYLDKLNIKDTYAFDRMCMNFNTKVHQQDINRYQEEKYIFSAISDYDKALQEEKRRNVELQRENEELRCNRKKRKRLRDKLFPLNSKRRIFAKLLLKAIRHPIWFLKHLSIKNIKKFRKYSRTEGGERALERIDAYHSSNSESSINTLLSLFDMTKRKEYPLLELPKYENPLVSIIIPVYNQFSYTYGCLESIISNTKNVSYEVIIGDDCSEDETKELQKYCKNIVINRNEKNLRFLLNCNNAAKLAKGKYILFLNNDTNVQPNWLNSLVETIESRKTIGMVGSKLLYPNGKLQEAGGILWKDGSAWNYGHSSDPQASEYNYRKPVDYISGAAIMIKASLWNEIGGFDELFVPAYCEDSDLAFEVRKRGQEVIYDPFSAVVHYEGVSNGTDLSQGVKKYQVDNSKKFFEKWEKELSTHYPNGENVFVARERSYNKKKLLMIDHYVPQFDKDAGSRTVYEYLKLFVDMGYDVKFIGENFYRQEPYTSILQKMGIEVLYGPKYSSSYEHWLKINGKEFDIVFFNRPHITKKFIDVVKANCSKAKFIYYGHDLHYVRTMREYKINRDPKLKKESEEWKKIEYDLFSKVDLVLYPSGAEIDLIKKEKPNVNAKILQPYLYENKQYKEYKIDNRDGILFVGGFRHAPNFDGIMWFINEVFPSIIQKNKKIRLTIAGSFPPQELIDKANENIVVKGFVSDEELEQLYKTTRLVVVPLRYGAGIKGKVIEAMANGVPVITTPCGGEGIVTDGVVIDESLHSIIDLYDNEEKLVDLSKKEYEYIQNTYTVKSAKNKMVKMLKDLSLNK